MKIIAIIPARGGSKGIPRKNVRLMNNRPLIAYAIRTALRTEMITDVLVSTDDDEIADISAMYGAKVIPRPSHLAGDDVTLDPVIHHAVECYEKENGSVDVVITDYGIAINPRRQDLIEAMKDVDLPFTTIEELRDTAYAISGEPERVQFLDRVVGIIESRDGTIMDVVRQIRPFTFSEEADR